MTARDGGRSFFQALAQRAAGQGTAAFGMAEVLGVIRRRHLAVLYDIYSRPVVEWPVLA